MYPVTITISLSVIAIYNITGKYREERKLYKRAEKDFPGNHILIYNQAVLALSEGKRKEAEALIEKYLSVCREEEISESLTYSNIGGIYDEAGQPEEAENYYRKALSMDPENPGRMNNLAWFLIDQNLNLEEGIELAEKALQMRSDYYMYLDTRGWGLYKQGKYKEAPEYLEKCRELKPGYEHEIYLQRYIFNTHPGR